MWKFLSKGLLALDRNSRLILVGLEFLLARDGTKAQSSRLASWSQTVEDCFCRPATDSTDPPVQPGTVGMAVTVMIPARPKLFCHLCSGFGYISPTCGQHIKVLYWIVYSTAKVQSSRKAGPGSPLDFLSGSTGSAIEHRHTRFKRACMFYVYRVCKLLDIATADVSDSVVPRPASQI
jgi:hypothetical protein